MRKQRKTERILLQNIEITDAGAEGKSIARHDNMVIFVNNAAPGDVADILIHKKKKNFAEGTAIRFEKLSSLRENPFCSHFGMCGGCKWQHLKYEHQLFYKQKQVVDNFERIAKANFDKIEPIIPSEKQKYYRNKLEYTFSDYRWLTNEDMALKEKSDMNMNGLGFHIAQHFDRVLDIDFCYLQAEPTNHIRNSVKNFCHQQAYSFYNPRKHEGFMRNIIVRTTTSNETMIIVVFGESDTEKQEKLLHFIQEIYPEITSLMYVTNTKFNDTISDLPITLFHGQAYITEQLGNLSFRIGPVSFFQTNSLQAKKMYDLIKDFAQIKPMHTIYDLYTGTGTIANYIAKDAKMVVGIEYISSAVEDAVLNAKQNSIYNTAFFSGDMVKILTDEFISIHGKPDIIITDPPRNGMHPQVIEQIIKMSPQRLVYVSCNPATQARDIALLNDMFKIKIVQPIDMFPHTHHVENIVLMENRF